ncbi:MAG: malate dehydrogenase [Candidatus Dasytiphilus stammeri]
MKVSIIGAAGNIGQILSLILKIKLPSGSELNLYDISPVIFGIALDLSHIPNAVKVKGLKQIESALEADLVIITAGVARKPGMTRSDLFHANASIVYTLSKKIALISPQPLIMVITNPLNIMVPIVAEVLKNFGSSYNSKKLFGITTLDVIRANTFITELKGQLLSNDVTVIGGHSSKTILPLLSHLSNIILTKDEVINITQRIRNAGTEVVDAKIGYGSASLAMGYAASRFVFSLLKALNEVNNIRECAYIEGDGKYVKFFAQPFMLGNKGITEFLPIEPLSVFEKQALYNLIKILKEEIKIGEEFVNNHI